MPLKTLIYVEVEIAVKDGAIITSCVTLKEARNTLVFKHITHHSPKADIMFQYF